MYTELRGTTCLRGTVLCISLYIGNTNSTLGVYGALKNLRLFLRSLQDPSKTTCAVFDTEKTFKTRFSCCMLYRHNAAIGTD